jgi:toluene monooxygenase system protein D
MSEREVHVTAVGPVLQPTPFGRAAVAAIQAQNDNVVVDDEGAYIRVHTPGICRLTKAELEAQLGHEVRFPGDLEVAMPSFSGLVEMTDTGAMWWQASEPKPDAPK